MIKTFSLWFSRGILRLCRRGDRTRSGGGWSIGRCRRRSCWSCRRICWRNCSWLSSRRPVEEKIPYKPIQIRLLEKSPGKSTRKGPSRLQEAFNGGKGRRSSEYHREFDQRHMYEERRDRKAP